MKTVLKTIGDFFCGVVSWAIAIVYVGVVTIVPLAILIWAIRWILVMLGVTVV